MNPAVGELRRAIEYFDGDELTDGRLAMVIELVGGDVDLAVEAIALDPRPTWLSAMIGDDLGRVRRPA